MSVKGPSDSGFDLKSVLERLGLSQRKLARLLGATQDWVGRLHNGHNSPSWTTALRIARVLEVSVSVFVPGDPARDKFLDVGHAQHVDPMAAAKRASPAAGRKRPAAAGRRRKQPAA